MQEIFREKILNKVNPRDTQSSKKLSMLLAL